MLLLLMACEAPPDGAFPDDALPDDDTAAPADPFLDARDGWLDELAVPILDCVGSADTNAPAFHGCYDWHSAVHGTWALLALSRLTGDPGYAEVADAQLTPEAIAGELADLESGALSAEIPYGYAWLLTLAGERDDLDPLAMVAEAQLADWVEGLSAEQAERAALAPDYQNLSWALLNLWQQADRTGDGARREQWEDAVRELLLPLDCPLEADESPTNFFPPCLHRALAIATVLPPEEASAWAATSLPEELVLTPVTEFPRAHLAGQNFSRTWGLWALWELTGDARYRDSYVEHLTAHMATPEYWADDYDSYAHWVAQFGVYGLAMSYD